MPRPEVEYWLTARLPLETERGRVLFDLSTLIEQSKLAVPNNDWGMIHNAITLAECVLEANLNLDLTDAAAFALEQITASGAQLMERRYGPIAIRKQEKGYYGLKTSTLVY